MNEQDIKNLIVEGENQTVEFKLEQENNRDFAKTFAAFANTPEGGKVLVGIDDSGNILGIKDRDDLMLRLNNIAFNNCKPPVSIFIESCRISDKEILVVNIPSGLQRPYKVSGVTYIRSNNQTREATREEELRLYQSSLSILYDEIPVSQADINDLNIELFRDFLKNFVEIDNPEENETINYLKNFHLITDDKIPTITGMLFFGKEPQKFLPHSKYICAAFHGNDISDEPYDKKEAIGALKNIINEIERFIKIHLINKHKIKDFQPEGSYELPLTALRELIVNSIAHRDYTIFSPNRLLIFEDVVEIHSVGNLPNTVTIESMKVGGSHVLRNPTIYNVLVKMKMVTDLGSGVRRAIKLIKESTNKEPVFELLGSELIVKIYRN